MQAPDCFDQNRRIEGFCQVDVETGNESRIAIGRRRKSRQSDDGRRSKMEILIPAERRNERIAVIFRQADIGDNHIRPLGLYKLKRFRHALSKDHTRTIHLQNDTQKIPRIGIVLEHQDAYTVKKAFRIRHGFSLRPWSASPLSRKVHVTNLCAVERIRVVGPGLERRA